MAYHPDCEKEADWLRGVTVPDGLLIGDHIQVGKGELMKARLLSDLLTGGIAVARSGIFRARELRKALKAPRIAPPGSLGSAFRNRPIAAPTAGRSRGPIRGRSRTGAGGRPGAI